MSNRLGGDSNFEEKAQAGKGIGVWDGGIAFRSETQERVS